MKYFPFDFSSFGDETYSPENQTVPVHTVPFDHHPCNRQVSSSPDEATTDIPASAEQWLPALPGLASPFCNARSPHRHIFRAVVADSFVASTDQKRNAETDSPAEDLPRHLVVYLCHARPVDRPLLALVLLATVQLENHPLFLGVLPDCSVHHLMTDVVKEAADVQVYYPIIIPASLSGLSHPFVCRFPWAIPIGIRRTHQSPSKWQHSLPACSLALTGRGFHPLDFHKWFPLLRYWFLHFHAYPSATQRSLTLRPACSPSRLATLCTRGFSSLVASTAAMIATASLRHVDYFRHVAQEN